MAHIIVMTQKLCQHTFSLQKKSTKIFFKKKNETKKERKKRKENSIIAPIHLPKSLDSRYTQYFTIVEEFRS